jgi:phage terminase large subunit GpA-like protein
MKTASDRWCLDLSPRLREALRKVHDGWRPAERLSASEWAARNIRLSSVDSAEFGLYNPGRAPYQREILDCFSDDSVQRVVFQASAQVGKTLLELLALAYVAVNRPGGVLYCLPGKETCEKISKDRLQPLLDANSALAGRFVEVKSRDSGNTIARKQFVGGYVQFATLNSPAALSSSPMPVILFDEVDRSEGVNEEGDAVSQAEKRTATFWNRKIFMISTPRDLETSVIHREFLLGDQRHFLVPCPVCGERHRLTWGGLSLWWGMMICWWRTACGTCVRRARQRWGRSIRRRW